MSRTFSPSEREAVMKSMGEKIRAINYRDCRSPGQQGNSASSDAPRQPRIRFYSPSELRAYQPEDGLVLVGDCHIMRGEVFLIGGEPGVGKSRAATSLAVCGATAEPWFGLAVHRRFRTMIVQNENGRFRLKQEFEELTLPEEIDNWIRVSEPPPFGLTINNSEFKEDIKAALDAFHPDLVILDPWNAVAKDDRQKDYAETFDALRNMLPTGTDKPALGIVTHTRKPGPNEKRTGGTGLMHILAGSYILTSVPRTIFVLVRGSDDETDDSVVLFNPKNSNGPNAARGAWHRQADGFAPDTDFDWREFDKPSDKRVIVRLEHLEEVFQAGDLALNEAAHALATVAGINERSAYNALAENGKFAENLSRRENMLSFRPRKVVHSSKSLREIG